MRMRFYKDLQRKLGEVNISEIILDKKTRRYSKVIKGIANYAWWQRSKRRSDANSHREVREFLGFSLMVWDEKYTLQTIENNLPLITKEIMNKRHHQVSQLRV